MESEVKKVSKKPITQFQTSENPIFKKEEKIFKKNNIGRIIDNAALRNINLSSVPSIVQDAIEKMALSVEARILASALLLQIQRDIENLGDAIVEKSYINEQISYITSIVNQKSDSGDVASTIDSKLALVTKDLATANQVNNLSSRLEDSYSYINQINQTLNTKDEAIVSMIEEAQAQVDENLSNYSAVLNLTVDKDGNVVSSRLESLEAKSKELTVTIAALDKIVIDQFGKFKAEVTKLITDDNGNITGYSFVDGSDIKSSFTINTDNFKIANSSNSYIPFRIENNNLYFNGKVAFTSIQSTNEDWQKQVQNAINDNATYIDGDKIVTNQAFVNNLNAVGGVVADSVTANALKGVTIEGAIITGTVIKASYIDLDGELEVLTDYKISVAMYNADKSLYSDAVYIKGDNNYRIPSLSVINSLMKSMGDFYKDAYWSYYDPQRPYNGGSLLHRNPLGYTVVTPNVTSVLYRSFQSLGLAGVVSLPIGTTVLRSELWSYNTANVGTNKKATRAKPPQIQIGEQGTNTILCQLNLGQSFSVSQMNGTYYEIKIGNISLFKFEIIYPQGADHTYTFAWSGLVGSGTMNYDTRNMILKNIQTISGAGITIKFGMTQWSIPASGDNGGEWGANPLNIILEGQQTLQLTDNWLSGELVAIAECKNISTAKGTMPSIYAATLPRIEINNML